MGPDSNTLIDLKGISKTFGVVRANQEISLQIKKGSIHALVGENGAGKSTLLKILYGMLAPDRGEIRVKGVLKKWRSPQDAVQNGLGMVHQHFMLAGPHTALDNILIGAEVFESKFRFLPRFLMPIDRKQALQRLEEISKENGFKIPFQKKVEDLPVGIQQRIEIIKLLYRNVDVLILDEPTAVLTPAETQDLFTQLRRLRDQGKSILMVTHKLKEVMELSDEVTVIRGGKWIASANTVQTNEKQLAEWMVGRPLQQLRTHFEKPNTSIDPILEITSLGLKVYPGQVVGIAGVEGNGQSELVEQIFRTRKIPRAEQVFSEGHLFSKSIATYSALQIREAGAALIAEDRHKQGLLLERPVWENFLLGHERCKDFSTRFLFRWIKKDKILKALEALLVQFEIRPANPFLPIQSFSGGNQQKLIVAREFFENPKFLCAAQPTRGVDVGAIELIHQKILDEKKKGLGVLLISSELEELYALSDEILVMYEKKIVAKFEREANGVFDQAKIGLALGGALA